MNLSHSFFHLVISYSVMKFDEVIQIENLERIETDKLSSSEALYLKF